MMQMMSVGNRLTHDSGDGLCFLEGAQEYGWNVIPGVVLNQVTHVSGVP